MGALYKSWKGYVIAKNKYEDDKMELYARRIQECQHDLGLPITSFDNIGMSASAFYGKSHRRRIIIVVVIVTKENNMCQKNSIQMTINTNKTD